MLAEKTGEWYEDDYLSPFMILVYKTREDKRSAIPAVKHVADTGRLQTVTRSANERYHRLIERFSARSGTPIVLNTSFNENEPIVCTPEEAINCFLKAQMDVLVLENHVISRNSGR